MTSKDYNFLKNTYLQSVVLHNNIGRVIDIFDNNTSSKTDLKNEIILLLYGEKSDDKKWDSLLNPKYFNKNLKTILEKLKA